VATGNKTVSQKEVKVEEVSSTTAFRVSCKKTGPTPFYLAIDVQIRKESERLRDM
jgi:hypothetical protein